MMKLLLFAFCFSIGFVALSQDKSGIPSVQIKKMDGSSFNTTAISNNGKPILISFWATWCKPCVKELTAIAEKYDDWKKEFGLVVYAVSIDDSKSSNRVVPFVNGKGWDYEVLLDANSDFKRAMNVVNVPHTFILDGKGKIVYQHTTYQDGDENKIYEIMKKIVAGEEVK